MKLLNITYILAISILAAMGLAGCTDAPDDIFTNVEMIIEAPDGEMLTMVRPDNGQPSTFLRDINNNRQYPIPLFVDNRAQLRMERGIYVMAFDGDAVLPDGTTRRVRMSGHSVMRDAIILNKPSETITIKVSFI